MTRVSSSFSANDEKPNLVDIGESLENVDWKPSRLRHSEEPKTARRSKRPNYKQHVIEENEYLEKRLIGEWIAEFDYQSSACDLTLRMVSARKRIETARAGKRLFEEYTYFFYITNESKARYSSRKWSSGQMIVATMIVAIRRTPSVNFMHPEHWQLRLII